MLCAWSHLDLLCLHCKERVARERLWCSLGIYWGTGASTSDLDCPHSWAERCQAVQGQEESERSLFQLCEYRAHVELIQAYFSLLVHWHYWLLNVLESSWPHKPLLINGQLSSRSHASFQRNNTTEHHHRCHLHSLVPGTCWTGAWQLLDVV